jgi:hypothetical protein
MPEGDWFCDFCNPSRSAAAQAPPAGIASPVAAPATATSAPAAADPSPSTTVPPATDLPPHDATMTNASHCCGATNATTAHAPAAAARYKAPKTHCQNCGQSFSYAACREKHERLCTGAPTTKEAVFCQKCGQSFMYVASKEKHERLCTGAQMTKEAVIKRNASAHPADARPAASPATSDPAASTSAVETRPLSPSVMHVKTLRALLTDRGVEHDTCIEKRDFIDLIREEATIAD